MQCSVVGCVEYSWWPAALSIWLSERLRWIGSGRPDRPGWGRGHVTFSHRFSHRRVIEWRCAELLNTSSFCLPSIVTLQLVSLKLKWLLWKSLCQVMSNSIPRHVRIKCFPAGYCTVVFERHYVLLFKRFWRAGASSLIVQSPQFGFSRWTAKMSRVKRKVCCWSVEMNHLKVCTPVCLLFIFTSF